VAAVTLPLKVCEPAEIVTVGATKVLEKVDVPVKVAEVEAVAAFVTVNVPALLIKTVSNLSLKVAVPSISANAKSPPTPTLLAKVVPPVFVTCKIPSPSAAPRTTPVTVLAVDPELQSFVSPVLSSNTTLVAAVKSA